MLLQLFVPLYLYTWSKFRECPNGGTGSQNSPFLANFCFCHASKKALKFGQSPKIASSGQTNLEVNLFTYTLVRDWSSPCSCVFAWEKIDFRFEFWDMACFEIVMIRQAWLSVKSTLFCRNNFFISSKVALDEEPVIWRSLASKAGLTKSLFDTNVRDDW